MVFVSTEKPNRDVEDAVLYNLVFVSTEKPKRDVEDAVPYNLVFVSTEKPKRDVEDAVPYKLVFVRTEKPKRDVEDAVPYNLVLLALRALAYGLGSVIALRISLTFSIRSTNCSVLRDWTPSHKAFGGSLCTSMISPSAPPATAASAIGFT